jgi:DNA-binding GntR family transcriptional regulator
MMTRPRKNLTPTDVADQVRNDILAGRLNPGQRLTEAELSRRFGVGRGRVREAIHQLARQGLLLTRPNCGATVAPEAPEGIRDLIVPIRRTVELYALEHGFDRLDAEAFRRWEAVLADMHAACEHRDFPSMAEADIAFHRLVVACAGEPDLLVIWETLVGRIRSHFLYVQPRQARLLDLYDEHRHLIDTFRAGDRAAALKLLAEKID